MTDEEQKSTFTKDEYGDYKEWAQFVFIFLVIGGMFLFIAVIFTGIAAIQDKYEIQAFNRIHGTDYTWAEWFWAEGTIKNYHLGTVENQNYQVDLNIKGLKGGGE